MTRMPVSSPWAPAAGWSVTACMPPISASIRLQLPQQLERALGQRVRRQRVELREAGQAGGPLVDLGVVLHRARAQRVEAAVHRVVEVREVDEVADDLGLVELRQRQRRAARRCSAGMPSSASAGGCGTLSPRRPGRDSSASVGWSVAPDGAIAGRGRVAGSSGCRGAGSSASMRRRRRRRSCSAATRARARTARSRRSW